MSTLIVTNVKNTSSATNNIVNNTDGSSTIAGASITLGASVASTSGTSINFTGIPSWVKRITVMFNGVSTNGSSIPQIQLGDSGGVETTGYNAMVGHISTLSNTTRGTTATSGFILQWAGGAGNVMYGSVIISLLASNTFTCSGVLFGPGLDPLAGAKTLSSTLDRIRITTVNGTDTFDAGTINFSYE